MTCMVANSLRSFDDDAEDFLLDFQMYVQIASTDIYMATQNCNLYTKYSESSKLKVPTKSKARSLRTSCSCRSFTQGHWSCRPIH